MTRLAPRVAALLCLGLPALASAQPEPAEPSSLEESPTPPSASVPAEPPASDSYTRYGTPDRDPNLPEVQDGMLEPVPPPKHVVQSWRDALRLVRSRNTSLRMAAAQVQLAAGQSRQALAAALPSLTGTADVTRHLITGVGVKFDTTGVTRGSIPDPLTAWTAGLALRVPIVAPRHGTRSASNS
jgi:hypothetical protein